MKLNLGCGDRYVDGWWNVDFGSPHRMDENVNLANGPLPWEPGTVTHVYAGHLFEHLTYEECLDLSAKLLHLMDPRGGLMVVVGPDITIAKQMIAEGTFDATYHSLESLVHGGSRWPGDEHRWETTGNLITQLLRDAGWPIAHNLGLPYLADFWPVADRGPAWQYAVRAWSGEKEPRE